MAHFFTAVDSAVARYEDVRISQAARPAEGQKLPPMRKAVGGYYHSLAISTAGRLFSWGCGNFGGENDGQQGFGDLVERTDPAPVDCRAWGADAKVLDAAAGCYHSVALAEPGTKDNGDAPKVYTWGLNNYGQLARAGLAADPREFLETRQTTALTTASPQRSRCHRRLRGRRRSRCALCAGSNQVG